MEKKIPFKTVVRLSDNDKRILLAYSNTLSTNTNQLASKAAVEKSFLKMA